MTSDLSDEVGSLRLNDDRVRLPANSTSRRNYATGQNQRHKLHSKRAATIDAENNDEKLRIVVLGATKVGKTCLCQQFLEKKFVTDHKETVDEMHSIVLSLADRQITLEILDTAGIDEFPVMRRIAIAHGDAFLIVYAINDAYSFDIAQQLRQLILEIKTDLTTSSIPIIIVGNKCDLDINTRKIHRDYAESIVRDQWATTLVETTCHERESVFNAFHLLLQLVNIDMTLNSDATRRSSDPSLSTNKDHRSTNKRQSCAQQ